MYKMEFDFFPIRAGVPNLGYMYPQGYISLSEGVHLRLRRVGAIVDGTGGAEWA